MELKIHNIILSLCGFRDGQKEFKKHKLWKNKGKRRNRAIVLGTRNEAWQLRDSAVATNTHMQLKTADGRML